MRGKRKRRNMLLPARRITPAHAGKTSVLDTCYYYNRDHPRACGENNANIRAYILGKGSPPRMRGKPVVSSLICRCRRITPAHAGKTYRAKNASYNNQDHPRACGENAARRCLVAVNMGSPPRMRGKLITQKAKSLFLRITPAHAGKTDIFSRISR